MNVEELPGIQVLETLSEEDKKLYLPGTMFSGIMAHEMELAQSKDFNERDECRDMIDKFYLYANKHGVDTFALQQLVRITLPIALGSDK